MSVTIKDVAREAGVSLMTVSRVVNNKGQIAKATREKVRAVIAKLDYKPNKLARSLVVQKSDFIFVIAPDIANPFFADLVKNAEVTARERNYHVILGDSEGLIQNEKAYIDAAIGRMADGIILVAPRIEDSILYEINTIVPLVVVDRRVPYQDILQVYIDNFDGAYTAVTHLIEIGHRRIAHLTGPGDVLNSIRREEGYRRALDDHGIAFDPWLVISGDFHFKSGYQAIDRFLMLNDPPTAVFVSNDLMAYGMIQRATETGVKIPDELSIVGFDDISISALINPPLTTVRHPMAEMGRAAVNMLLEQLHQNDETKHTLRLENNLIIRHSTRPLKEKK